MLLQYKMTAAENTTITSSENTSSCHYGTTCLYGIGIILTASTLFYGGYWYRGRSSRAKQEAN